MRIEPGRPPRPDETPAYTYLGGQRLTDELHGVPIRIEPFHPGRGDATPACIYNRGRLNPGGIGSYFRFGDWLVRRGLIDRHQLFVALSHASARSTRLGDALVELELVDRCQVEEEAAAFADFAAFQES
jgi:hypothetical protein